jgi:hypothetical protein
MNGVGAAGRPTRAPHTAHFHPNLIRNLNIPREERREGGGGALALLQISQLEIFYRNSYRTRHIFIMLRVKLNQSQPRHQGRLNPGHHAIRGVPTWGTVLTGAFQPWVPCSQKSLSLGTVPCSQENRDPWVPCSQGVSTLGYHALRGATPYLSCG